MKRFFVFYLLVAIIESCQQNLDVIETLPDYIIKVPKEQISEEKLPLHTLFDSVEVIFPDRKDSVLLGQIEGIWYNGKDYYVLDEFYQLYQFTLQGKLVHNFTKIGRGPYEYIYLKDVFYDHLLQQLILLAGPYYKMIFIDKNGEYMQEVNLPFKGSAFECIASVKDSILLLGYSFDNDKYFGSMSYYYQDSLTPYKIINQRDFKGTYPAYYWAKGELEDHKLIIGYTHSFDTLSIISPRGLISKQALKLQLENPYTILHYRYVYNGLMMIWVNVDKGDMCYGYSLLHDRLSGKSKMWNSFDFAMVGRYLCADHENMYFIYNPTNSIFWSPEQLQELGYGSILEKLKSLHLTENDNPVILRYHLRTPEELRQVLVQ